MVAVWKRRSIVGFEIISCICVPAANSRALIRVCCHGFKFHRAFAYGKEDRNFSRMSSSPPPPVAQIESSSYERVMLYLTAYYKDFLEFT